MSDIRVALIAEGPTDAVVIESILVKLLPRTFTLTLLQPEATRPQVGTGWCGVFKWCREFASRGATSLEGDPTLPAFDIFVIHVDADVADKAYGDCGASVLAAAAALPVLPCAQPCPPPDDACNQIRARLCSWLGVVGTGPKTVLCVPSKAVDAWLVAGVFSVGHSLLTNLECNLNVERQLSSLPKNQRINKTVRDYRRQTPALVSNTAAILAACSQAARFAAEIALVPL